MALSKDQQEIMSRYVETRSCKIKVRYLTRSLAKEKARRMSLKSKTGRVRAYKCKFCPDYHIGHNKYA